jgi:hypothetical protein
MTRVTQAERLAKIERDLAATATRLDDIHTTAQELKDHYKSAKETHDAVNRLSEALMTPQPGHDKSLLDRIATATIAFERGNWSVKIALAVLGFASAAGAAYATVKGFVLPPQ